MQGDKLLGTFCSDSFRFESLGQNSLQHFREISDAKILAYHIIFKTTYVTVPDMWLPER